MSNPSKSCVAKKKEIDYNKDNPGYHEPPYENETWDNYILRQMQYERSIKNGTRE